jgi:hypothetical protein
MILFRSFLVFLYSYFVCSYVAYDYLLLFYYVASSYCLLFMCGVAHSVILWYVVVCIGDVILAKTVQLLFKLHVLYCTIQL